MVALGDEGFGSPGGTTYPYGYSEGVNYTANLEIETLDFGTFHLYPESCEFFYPKYQVVTTDTQIGGEENSFGPGWIKAHGAACEAAGKPCLLEEYGTETDICGIQGGWQTAALEAPGLAADAFWQFGDTQDAGDAHGDPLATYYGTPRFTCMVTDHLEDIKNSPKAPA